MNTFAEMIIDAAARHGSRTALILAHEHSNESWTYGDLYGQARRTAQLLAARDIAKGERVMLWAPNGPRWVSAFFGCALAGVVVVPLDVKSTPEFVGKVAAQTEPRLVVATAAAAKDVQRLGLPHITVEEMETALPADDPAWQAAPVAPDDLAEIVFTSGTTGAPKGVMLSHANILSDLIAVEEYIPPAPGFHMLSLLPLSHMFEQIAELFFALSAGACVVYPDSLTPSTIFRAMRDVGVTAIPVVPQILALIMAGIEREVRKAGKMESWERAHRLAPRLPLRLRRIVFRDVHEKMGGQLRFIVSGGAYLDPKLAQRFENLGIKVIIGYGMTEASPIVTANSLRRRNLRSIGKVISSNQIKIADDGELLVRGHNVTRGYWRNEEATAAAFEDGWYKTGDLCEMDSDGYLYLKGRKKNIIVLSNGMNVYPEDIENALKDEPGVTDAVVIGREQDGDIELHAILLLQNDADAAAIVKAANKRLAQHQRVKGNTVWPDRDFPRTPTLKAKRDEMVKRVESMLAPVGAGR